MADGYWNQQQRHQQHPPGGGPPKRRRSDFEAPPSAGHEMHGGGSGGGYFPRDEDLDTRTIGSPYDRYLQSVVQTSSMPLGDSGPRNGGVAMDEFMMRRGGGGLSLASLSPCPKRFLSPSPHVNSFPDDTELAFDCVTMISTTAAVCQTPHETAMVLSPDKDSTSLGYLTVSLSPCPNTPNVPSPNVNNLP
ncbi:hypothetical protein F2Q70_00045573 [Brassica cretica]|uniref:Uncharacterized protein n=1 Tax=Brassica cretica TaxID=69181 RepID=A0A8S9KLM2_BRACR|nr:hypothetical protein F2Q70_00045573 [Brassica cretica]KAF3517070.1 hypothetical protein DY000_02064131 [Brassica cretica]